MTVNEGNWEQNMADRARERRIREYEEAKERRQKELLDYLNEKYPDAPPGGESEYIIECVIQKTADEMSVEDAQQMHDNPWACACMGPRGDLMHIPGAPCKCRVTWMAIERVLEIKT